MSASIIKCVQQIFVCTFVQRRLNLVAVLNYTLIYTCLHNLHV